MKRLIAAIVFVIMCFALCIVEYSFVANCERKYTSQIDDILLLTENGERQQAQELCTKLHKQWDKSSKIIDLFLIHNQMDDIGGIIVTLGNYVKYENDSELFAMGDKIKNQLISLKISELPLIENIL